MSRRVIVEFTQNFERNLDEIEQFLLEHDAPGTFAAPIDHLLDTLAPNLEQFPDLGAVTRVAGCSRSGTTSSSRTISRPTGSGESSRDHRWCARRRLGGSARTSGRRLGGGRQADQRRPVLGVLPRDVLHRGAGRRLGVGAVDLPRAVVDEDVGRRGAVAALPNARHAIIPAAGHRVPWEEPAAFTETVSNFLSAENLLT